MAKTNVKNDLKLGFMERKIYNQLYSTIEKVLKSSYEIYCQFSYNDNDNCLLSYDAFGELVNKKLKGE